ncbi:LacI family DNA-binding transcriptional regulator [Bacillus sp. PS06]|uniref:LacI family DNA-binding transcriptional regulator n=1 Tax=Bacillus sp. PS06 TaxID=2764176 RepID=UPI00177B8D05|nr:LacI family DNA-binding transcriptional regulator [Bacillus sp. PS06]MBD8069539.1 LacI family DNA-binding transcriptional regulator [Bacillus sp. PS06]
MERPTIKDIARMANVSIGTVSNVINGKGRYSEETRKKIEKIIKESNYMPNVAARSLKDKMNPLIALVVPFAPRGEIAMNPFFSQLIAGVESGARDRRFHVIVTGVKDEPDLSFLLEKQITGLIVFGANDNPDLLEDIRRLHLPTVYMDSYLSDPDLYQVGLNDEMGGYLGTKYLISQGHRSIMVISGQVGESVNYNSIGHYRLAGYRKALEEAGIEYNPDFIIPNNFSLEEGYHSAQQIMQYRGQVTAVFAFSDLAAMGLIKGFYDLNISVPDDFSVMGFDDLYFSEYVTPGLTTVRQDIYGRGQAAVKLVIDQIENNGHPQNRNIILPVSLKVRQSTAVVTNQSTSTNLN